MASGFIGISVIVTLQNPPNTLVHGVVAAVNPQNATLTLQDGAFSCRHVSTRPHTDYLC
jgi:enhancer of mRNA-decapping protein 3